MYLSVLYKQKKSFQNITTNIIRTSFNLITQIFTAQHYQCGTMSTMSSEQNENVFQGKKDRFQGVTVDSDDEHCDHFVDKLTDSLKHWLENKTRTVWFKVALKHSDWVPILAQNGFEFHHASKGFVMMYRWLPSDEQCHIPPFCHTMVGCGAIVLNASNQVLIVKEKHAFISAFKLPGGYVDPGENLIAAAQREVKEETNIETTYDSVVCFRHVHGANFNMSDLYFIISLKALNEDIKIDEREIVECKWVDIDELLQGDIIHDHNKAILKKYLENKNKGVRIECKEHMYEVIKRNFFFFTIEHH